MGKEKTLEAIQNARDAHKSQMDKIKSLLAGEKVKDPTAVEKTQCAFGKWLYDEENNLPRLLGSLFYTKVEVHHAKWHTEYIRLFQIFFKDEEKKKGFFAKFLGEPKINDMDIDKAKLYYSELEVTTGELLKMLDSCERKVNAMNEEKFKL